MPDDGKCQVDAITEGGQVILVLRTEDGKRYTLPTRALIIEREEDDLSFVAVEMVLGVGL